MNLPPETIVAVPMAAAILVFFWALDRVRKERVRATLVRHWNEGRGDIVARIERIASASREGVLAS